MACVMSHTADVSCPLLLRLPAMSGAADTGSDTGAMQLSIGRNFHLMHADAMRFGRTWLRLGRLSRKMLR